MRIGAGNLNIEEVSEELILTLKWNLKDITNELALNGSRIIYKHGEAPVEYIESNGKSLIYSHINNKSYYFLFFF